MRSARFTVLWLTALLLAAALPQRFTTHASAAVLMALDLRALVNQSDYVVLANAELQSSRYVDGLIVTDVRLRVINSLKGSAKVGSTLIATSLGGSVGQIGLRVPGTAQFTLGESALVFLRRDEASDDLSVTGMSQGVLPIFGAGSSAQVQLGGKQATLMTRDASGAYVPAPAPQRRTLADVLNEIARLAAESD